MTGARVSTLLIDLSSLLEVGQEYRLLGVLEINRNARCCSEREISHRRRVRLHINSLRRNTVNTEITITRTLDFCRICADAIIRTYF